MKIVYKALYPLGYEEHEVEDDFPIDLPSVGVPPILFEKKEDETNKTFGRRQQSRFFNFTEDKWEEAATQGYSEKLELLENLSIGLQVDDAALKKTNEKFITKAESLTQINLKIVLTPLRNTKDIATIKKQLDGGR